ncbi:MAG TPA: carboxy terminal-processing peptidase, partial [Steroidobacteraceae bacterium]|nr:carboxy terminal-processing peptidase [Steroidobacteraceae bacterium]
PWNRIRSSEFKREPGFAAVLPELQHEHDARVASDPDFQFAVAQFSALEQLRKQKTVSLNLAKRKAEREQLTQDNLRRENARREAHGLEPLKAAADIKDTPDAILAEAAQITADLSHAQPSYVAGRTPRPGT